MGKRRKKGEGSVRQRKDGRWEGRVVIGYDEKGLPRTKNVLAKTKRECQEKLKQLRETVTGPRTEKVRPEMPFGEWLDFWYQNYVKPQIRPTTQANYEAKIYQHIIPELGKIPLNQLAQKDLQQFYARMKAAGRLIRTEQFGKGLSDSMVRGLHAACRSALDKAVQEELIRTNPAVGCKLPPKRGREMQVLGREELQRFLIQAQAEGYFELFLLDLCTGLRRGELLALQWDDLDFKTGTLTVNKQVYEVKGRLQVSVPKTRASIRRLVLPPGVVEVLRAYRETVDSRWMFPSPVKEDVPMTPGAVRRRLQIILERAGCKKIRFHDLRHTFATLSLENGMDVKTLSAMLGHVSAATTLDIYTHVTGDMQSEAAAKIDRGLGNEVQEESVQSERDAAEDFQPVLRKTRKPGTGCITQINDHLFEGRYSPTWPDGTKHSKCVYAHTREECEEKLKVLIQQLNAERKAIQDRLRGIPSPEKLTKKQRQIWEYMRICPDETNYSTIAKGAKVTRHTVARWYAIVKEMVYGNSNNHSLCHSPDLKNWIR